MKCNNYILGLDISSCSTGWSVFSEDDGLTKYGILEIKKGKKGIGERLLEFENKLSCIIKEFAPHTIVIEDIYFGPSKKAFKVLAMFHGVAYKTCKGMAGFEPQLISVSQARKHISEQFDTKIKSKEDTFNQINDFFKLNFQFQKHNDITDSMALVLAITEGIISLH